MGFTERVTRLSDYDLDRRLTPLPIGASQTNFHRTEPNLLSDVWGLTDRRGTTVRVPARRPEFDPGHPRHVPETWPTLLSRDQLCAYVGVAAATITKVCPVRPLDMGANLVRYSRAQIDEWVATLPPRLMVTEKQHGNTDDERDTQAHNSAAAEIAESRIEAALNRVRARAGGPKCRKKA